MPEDPPPRRGHPLRGRRRGQASRRTTPGSLRKLGQISVPEQLPAPPPDNARRVRALRELILDVEGTEMGRTAEYVTWRLDALPALGSHPVHRFVRVNPVGVVAVSGELALVFGDTPAFEEGFLPLRMAAPGSEAAARHERYEFLATFERRDTFERLHAAPFEPPNWHWMI